MYVLVETAPQAIMLRFQSEDEVYRAKSSSSLTERFSLAVLNSPLVQVTGSHHVLPFSLPLEQ